MHEFLEKLRRKRTTMRINLAVAYTLSEEQEKDTAKPEIGLRSLSANRVWNARNAKYRKPGSGPMGSDTYAIEDPTVRKLWVRIDRALTLATKHKQDAVDLSEDQVDAIIDALEKFACCGTEAVWVDELCESMKADREAHKIHQAAKKNGVSAELLEKAKA